MITTSSWEQLTGATKWLLILVLGNTQWNGGRKCFSTCFPWQSWTPTYCTKESNQSPVLQRIFCRELVKQLITSSDISPSITPRGHPRRSAEGLTHLQPGYHFPEKIQGTGMKTNITRSCAVFLPRRRFWQGQERRGRDQEKSPVFSALSTKWPCASKTAFSCTTLFRTMLLPMFVKTMQIMIMPMVFIDHKHVSWL